jgi:hypothetical protein
MSRRASADDVEEICMALPDVELGTSWGDRPTYKVRGKGFLLYRAPHKTAVDPETGELYDDLLVVMTSTEVEKESLVADQRLPFFTIDHFRNFNAVLVRQSRLPEMERDELAEILTEAWAAKAPRTLVKKHFGDV